MGGVGSEGKTLKRDERGRQGGVDVVIFMSGTRYKEVPDRANKDGLIDKDMSLTYREDEAPDKCQQIPRTTDSVRTRFGGK